MKCVSYNIQYGKGIDGKIDLNRIAEEIGDADIIALQEVERFWPRSENVDQVAYFQQRFNQHYAVYGAGVDLHVENSSPKESKRRQFGNMILSRYPIAFSRNHLLPKHGSINPLSLQRSALETTIHINHTPIRFYSIHLSHISPTIRLNEIEYIMQIHKNVLHEGHPVDGNIENLDWQSGVNHQTVAQHAIMLGDFNCQPDSQEYFRMVGEISDYGGHIVSQDGFVDAWTHCGNDSNSGFTSDVGGKPARLDYIFVNTPIREKIQSVGINPKARGSDHFPIWMELVV